MERILCNEYEHIDLNIEKCPRCGSIVWEIHESLYVTDYCEGTHTEDLFSCFKCDASISIDLLMRLNEAEYRLRSFEECTCDGIKRGIELCECILEPDLDLIVKE